MSQLYFLGASIFIAEVFIRSNYLHLLRCLAHTTNKSLHLLSSSRISDHWKEQMIPFYSLKIMSCSVFILLELSPLALFLAVLGIFSSDFASQIFSFSGLLKSGLIGSLYILLRRTIVK